MTHCVRCSTEVEKTGQRGPQPKFCGPCLRERTRERQREARSRNPEKFNQKNRTLRAKKIAVRPAPEPELRVCEICSVEFERPRPLGPPPRFCPFCKAFRAAYSMQKSTKRRQAVIADGEKFTSLEIFERDEFTCLACYRPCEGVWPEPMAATLDHIVPIKLGGTHTRENVQTMHLLCNLRKSCSG